MRRKLPVGRSSYVVCTKAVPYFWKFLTGSVVQFDAILLDGRHHLLAVVQRRHFAFIDNDRFDFLVAHDGADATASGDSTGRFSASLIAIPASRP